MKTTGNPARRGHALAAAIALAASGGAWAAGHFDVDDAGMLDPGQCQYEAWATRARVAGGEPATTAHLGPACRVGAVELGLNLDHLWAHGERGTVLAGPQLKWTFFGQQAGAPLAAALSVSAIFDTVRGGRAGGQFVIPVTWLATEQLQIHANLGADWAPVSGARTVRAGLAAEWAVSTQLSLIAERNRAAGVWTSRVGLRFSFTPLISLDLSAARIGSGPWRGHGVAVGLNHAFDWR